MTKSLLLRSCLFPFRAWALFSSEATISCERMFVNKPVAFITTDIDSLKAEHNKLGKASLEQHYIVGNEQEVMAFINDVVLDGRDLKAAQRTEFCKTVLKTVVAVPPSQLIVDEIKKGLGL